jgi:hypothetical protein
MLAPLLACSNSHVGNRESPVGATLQAGRMIGGKKCGRMRSREVTSCGELSARARRSAFKEISQPGTLRVRRHLRLNGERELECRASLLRRDPRRPARPHRFKEGENFELQRLARSDFRLDETQSRSGAQAGRSIRICQIRRAPRPGPWQSPSAFPDCSSRRELSS